MSENTEIAVIRRYAAKVIPLDGESLADAKARLDAAWPRMLSVQGVQQVGTAVGVRPRYETIRHDRPGDQPAPYPFEIVKAAYVIDAAAPAEFVARIDPEHWPAGAVAYEPEAEQL